MRRMLESITDRITGFVAQRDDLAMVVRTAAEIGPAFLQVMGPIAESSEAGLFFTYDDEFDDPTAFVTSVVKAFGVQHEGVRAVMQTEGMTPWPPLPMVVGAEGLPAVLRMRELMIFSRSLLPQPDSQVVVWTFMPKKVASAARYGAFVRDLLAHEWPQPWCHHMRVIVRDDPADGAVSKAMPDAKRVQWYEPPLGPEAYQKGFEESAADPTLPVSERMQSLLVTAGTDCSWGRHEAAREKFQVLVWYFLSQRAPLACGAGAQRARRGACSDWQPGGRRSGVRASDGPRDRRAGSVGPDHVHSRVEPRQVADGGGSPRGSGGLPRRGPAVRGGDALGRPQAHGHGAAGGGELLAAGKPTEALALWEAGATVGDQLGMKQHRDAALRRLQAYHALNPVKAIEYERRMATDVIDPPPEVLVSLTGVPLDVP